MKKKTKKTKTYKPSVGALGFPLHLTENQVIQELRQNVQKLKVFDSLGKALTSSLDLSEVFRILVDKLGSLVNCSHVCVVLLNSETGDFYFEFPVELKEKQKSFPLGRGILGRSLERGRGGIFQNPQLDSNFDPEVDALVVENPTSLMTFPIMSRGAVLGSLVFFSHESESLFSEENYRTIETFSDYLSIAVENARNYQKVRELTITDDLTHLYNSRYLHLVLDRELARSERYQEQFSVVFIDLDNFKNVNDQNGHMAGSTLLKEFGDFLVQTVRTSDIAIRYGGDEFVLVLPRTTKPEAIQFVTRARDMLKDHVFLKNKQLNIRTTASFGISTFPEDGRTIDQIISAADKAMYYVKKGHKDGVYAYSKPATLLGSSRNHK